MLKKKSMLLTFDYELFLGNLSGVPEECLLKPTRRLIRIASKYPVKMIFFVDTMYLLKLRDLVASNEQCAKDFRAIVAQLKELSMAGHEIFPHIHPHWAVAEYNADINQWKLGCAELYRLHEFDEDDRKKMFSESLELLNDIVSSTENKNSMDGYRAGGWCIQPFSVFESLFREFGILYDFSVATRRWSFTEAHWIDFTAILEAKPYRFSLDIVKPSLNGEFTEFPISYLATNKWSRRLDKLLGKIVGRDRNLKKRGGILQARALNYDSSAYSDIYYMHMASPEYFRTAFMPEYLRFLHQNEYIHFIAHPKMLTGENLFWFDKLLAYVCRSFSVETDFRKFEICTEKLAD